MFNQLVISVVLFSFLSLGVAGSIAEPTESNPGVLKIKKTSDFAFTGNGMDRHWHKADWVTLPQRGFSAGSRSTRMKSLYSDNGIYFLFDCEDTGITSTMRADFMDLWNEDVVEVFLWTNEQDPVYFEYELSPFNYELPLLISNKKNDLVRWQPFHYEQDRKVRHATMIVRDSGTAAPVIRGWKAEFFIPYQLLRPLQNIKPKPGTRWRANMYRMDYDGKEPSSWSWQLTGPSFHDYQHFGVFVFGDAD